MLWADTAASGADNWPQHDSHASARRPGSAPPGPRVPQDCRATPTECAPAVGKAVSSRTHTSDLWSRATTVRAKRRGTAATAQGFCPTHGRRACPSAPAMRPAMGAIDVRSPSSHKPLTSTCAPWARSNRVKNGLNGVPARSRFLASWPQRTSHPISLQRELNRVLLEPSPCPSPGGRGHGTGPPQHFDMHPHGREGCKPGYFGVDL
jgi:hypothetical protein